MAPQAPSRPSAPAGRPLILLCNDDGFFRPEIRVLQRRLAGLGRSVIVAPDRERSASSLAVTLRQPLRLQRHGPAVWSVDGTPADCVYFALRRVLPRRPDLLISGLNPGPNLGQQDVHYSGTVAAALQAAFLGLPAMAVSMIPDASGRFHLAFAAGVNLPF
jgi:5'-nucleotidase